MLVVILKLDERKSYGQILRVQVKSIDFIIVIDTMNPELQKIRNFGSYNDRIMWSRRQREVCHLDLLHPNFLRATPSMIRRDAHTAFPNIGGGGVVLNWDETHRCSTVIITAFIISMLLPSWLKASQVYDHRRN